MPTYEYTCSAGHEFEKIQKMNDTPRAKCPECGKAAARRISGGAGFVFKGSGFYITDYGKDGKGPRKAEKEGGGDGGTAEAKPAAGEKSGADPKPKADTKPETKADAKPTTKKTAE